MEATIGYTVDLYPRIDDGNPRIVNGSARRSCTGWQGGEAVMARWRHQHERGYRVAIYADARMMNSTRMPPLSRPLMRKKRCSRATSYCNVLGRVSFETFFDARAGGAVKSNGPRVLVVDEDATFLDMAVLVIELLGFSTITARDTKKALEIIRSRPSLTALLTELPGTGVGGAELARLAKEANPGLSII